MCLDFRRIIALILIPCLLVTDVLTLEAFQSFHKSPAPASALMTTQAFAPIVMFAHLVYKTLSYPRPPRSPLVGTLLAGEPHASMTLGSLNAEQVPWVMMSVVAGLMGLVLKLLSDPQWISRNFKHLFSRQSDQSAPDIDISRELILMHLHQFQQAYRAERDWFKLQQQILLGGDRTAALREFSDVIWQHQANDREILNQGRPEFREAYAQFVKAHPEYEDPLRKATTELFKLLGAYWSVRAPIQIQLVLGQSSNTVKAIEAIVKTLEVILAQLAAIEKLVTLPITPAKQSKPDANGKIHIDGLLLAIGIATEMPSLVAIGLLDLFRPAFPTLSRSLHVAA